MSSRRKNFITVLFLLIPVVILAQEHSEMKAGKSLADFLFSVKYYSVFGFTILSLFVLWFRKFSDKVRVAVTASAFLLFGVAPLSADYLFLSPSPVCAVTKPFLFGLRPQFLATLSSVGVLSLISSKGFCSTACPVGGLQELLHKIPFYRKFKFSFLVSNSVRFGLFVLFIVVAVTLKTSAYFYYNLFDLIHWDFSMPAVELAEFILFLAIILFASVIFFKPFCYFICPMGLVTWVLEHFAVLKVRVDKSKCNACGLCEKVSPCPSVKSILDNKLIRGDCHLCGVCLNTCERNALYYGALTKK
ncbi:MAG: 4Fe-4S binding protein [Bacteroidetes bacterium]|nr:4Fe-4S binding protein [Bacteroidota bacterium]